MLDMLQADLNYDIYHLYNRRTNIIRWSLDHTPLWAWMQTARDPAAEKSFLST